MKDILELIKMLVAGTLDVNINLTVTGTVNITDPDGNYLTFIVDTTTP